MGKGSPRKTLRLADGLLDLVEDAVRRINRQRKRQEPRTVSSWIVAAVKEKLAHLDRAGRTRKGPRTAF